MLQVLLNFNQSFNQFLGCLSPQVVAIRFSLFLALIVIEWQCFSFQTMSYVMMWEKQCVNCNVLFAVIREAEWTAVEGAEIGSTVVKTEVSIITLLLQVTHCTCSKGMCICYVSAVAVKPVCTKLGCRNARLCKRILLNYLFLFINLLLHHKDSMHYIFVHTHIQLIVQNIKAQ